MVNGSITICHKTNRAMKISDFGAMPTVEVQPTVAVTPTEEKNDYQFLDFEKEKVQAITLDQLRMTNKENRGDNRDCPHGIYHFDFIQRIIDMADNAGYDVEVYDLFATNNRDKQTPGVSLYPELEDKYGPRAIQATTLRRVYANIRLKDFDDDELTTNLAVSYTQRGLQVGFGTNVKVCHNQNMIGKGNFVSDYSTHNHYTNGDPYKTDLNGIFAKIGSWLSDAEHIIINDKATIQRMKNTVLTDEQIFVIIGMLTSIRVQCDTSIKDIRYKGGVYPLNQTQIGKFTENLLVEQKKVGQITAWTLYNAATNLYKPQTCEQNLILPQNMAMVEFMRDREII